MRELYRSADLFVLPTAADASPHVVLEAMAAGVPVVSTDVGASEMVLDGETGVLVAPNSVGSLRDVLRSLIGDAPRRRTLALSAREHVKSHYDAAHNTARILEIMKQRARPGGPPRRTDLDCRASPGRIRVAPAPPPRGNGGGSPG